MFVALVIQHVTHICHIVLCGLSGLKLFFHIHSRRARFSKKKKKGIGYKMRVSVSFYTLFLKKILAPRRTERDIIINVHSTACKLPDIFVIF